MSGKAEGKVMESQESIKQIRDIIVGEELASFQNQIKQLMAECEQLKTRLADVESELKAKNESVLQDIAALNSSILDKQQIFSLVDELKQEFQREFGNLDEAKVDKSQIGQVFIEWGMKVKQTDVKKS